MVPIDQSLTVERSLPHGHVAAVLGTLRKIGLDRVLGILPAREMALIQAMIVNRVLFTGFKTQRGSRPECGDSRPFTWDRS